MLCIFYIEYLKENCYSFVIDFTVSIIFIFEYFEKVNEGFKKLKLL